MPPFSPQVVSAAMKRMVHSPTVIRADFDALLAAIIRSQARRHAAAAEQWGPEP